MASSSKKSGKSTIVKRQASAKQAYKKNSKKGSRKAQNEQLLDLLDQNAANTIHDATNSTKAVQPDFSALYQGNLTQSALNDLTSRQRGNCTIQIPRRERVPWSLPRLSTSKVVATSLAADGRCPASSPSISKPQVHPQTQEATANVSQLRTCGLDKLQSSDSSYLATFVFQGHISATSPSKIHRDRFFRISDSMIIGSSK